MSASAWAALGCFGAVALVAAIIQELMTRDFTKRAEKAAKERAEFIRRHYGPDADPNDERYL